VLELEMGETGLHVHLLVRVERCWWVLLLHRNGGVHVWLGLWDWGILWMARLGRKWIWLLLLGLGILEVLLDVCLLWIKELLLLLLLLIQLALLMRGEKLLLLALWARSGG
jgi:hypothetical protein